MQIDPDNRLLARYPLRRLDAEAIRDAMLAVSGELDDRSGGPYVPTDRTDTGEVVVDESARPACARLGLSPATPDPDRQPARSLRRPLDRHDLHPPPPFDRPAAIAQPAEFRLRRGPGRQAGRAAGAECPAAMSGLLRRAPDAIASRSSCWSIGRNPDERGTRRGTDGSCRPSPPVIPALAAPAARRRAWADFCQMLLASDAFLYVE